MTSGFRGSLYEPAAFKGSFETGLIRKRVKRKYHSKGSMEGFVSVNNLLAAAARATTTVSLIIF